MDGEIYLDNNATTRPLAEVRQAMFEALDEGFGNPSSDHARGQAARDALFRARVSVAALVNADPAQLIFTSSATEANNLVLHSIVGGPSNGPARIVTSSVEHSSVLNACEQLGRRGITVEHVPVDAEGMIDLAALDRHLASPTALVSIQWANNETGVVQPIADISALCHDRGVLLHVDAAQAVGKVAIDLTRTTIDFASLTAHKIHGPVGAGAIYARDPSRLRPMWFGGPQEAGLRPGTESLPAILGFGVAAQLRRQRFNEVETQLRQLRDEFEAGIIARVADVFVNGHLTQRLSNTSNLRFAGIDGQALVARLDQAGVRCSQSSACTSQHPEPSYVLRAMGLSVDDAWSSVRFGFGELNTANDVNTAVELIAENCTRLRRFKPRQPIRQEMEVG